MKNIDDHSRRRTQWFGVVGLRLPEKVTLHPGIEDAALRVVDVGGMALLENREDNNFGIVWGFDAPSSNLARQHMHARTFELIETVGAIGILKLDLRYNKRYALTPLAQVVDLGDFKPKFKL